MRVIPTTLILAALVLPAMTPSWGIAASADASLFGYFRDICLNTDAREALAASKARELGFAASKYALPASEIEDLQAFEKILEDRLLFVVIGRARSEATGERPASMTRTCGVTVNWSDPASAAEADAWAGVPVKRVESVAYYGFRQATAGRGPLPMDDRSAVRAAIESGEAGLLTITQTDMMTILALTRGGPAS